MGSMGKSRDAFDALCLGKFRGLCREVNGAD